MCMFSIKVLTHITSERTSRTSDAGMITQSQTILNILHFKTLVISLTNTSTLRKAAKTHSPFGNYLRRWYNPTSFLFLSFSSSHWRFWNAIISLNHRKYAPSFDNTAHGYFIQHKKVWLTMLRKQNFRTQHSNWSCHSGGEAYSDSFWCVKDCDKITVTDWKPEG